MEQVLDVSNDVAAELAGISDGVLDALRDRLGCTILLRGNRLTIEGDDASVAGDRQPVAAQEDRDLEAIAQRVEDAVADRGELGRDVVGDIENLFHSRLSVGRRSKAGPLRGP